MFLLKDDGVKIVQDLNGEIEKLKSDNVELKKILEENVCSIFSLFFQKYFSNFFSSFQIANLKTIENSFKDKEVEFDSIFNEVETVIFH